MEDEGRSHGKSLTIPVSQSPPFTVIAPTTLSKVFNMPPSSSSATSNDDVVPAAASNIIGIPFDKKNVDLNVPLLLEVDQSLSPPVVEQYSPSGVTKCHVPTLEQALEKELKDGSVSDIRKLRRTISNRLSAQRSRMKKAQYVVDLEKKIKELQETIAILSPQVEDYKNKQRALLTQKTNLEQQLHNCLTKSNLCKIEIEENKREVQRLKELQKIQQEQMMFASSNFGRQQSPNNIMYKYHHSQLLPPAAAAAAAAGSNYHLYYGESSDYPTNTDSAVADEYFDYDALN